MNNKNATAVATNYTLKKFWFVMKMKSTAIFRCYLPLFLWSQWDRIVVEKKWERLKESQAAKNKELFMNIILLACEAWESRFFWCKKKASSYAISDHKDRILPHSLTLDVQKGIKYRSRMLVFISLKQLDMARKHVNLMNK